MDTTLRFRNAAAITMDRRCPRADTVLVKGDLMVWVGLEKDASLAHTDRVIDCAGATLLPGFNDAHIHLLAYAASLRHQDYSRRTLSSIVELRRLLETRALTTPERQWIRGTGYDEFYLAEKRHPTRYDLDPVTPHNPVRLDHRSSHACVLNSRGLEEVGITADTPDPVDGVILRDDAGEPTGVLLEMNGYVNQRMRVIWDETVLHESVAEASHRLLRWGVTSLQDASPQNDLERWDTFCRLVQAGVVHQRLTIMPGARHLRQFGERGLRYDTGDSRLRLGPAKLVTTLTTGILHPPEEELHELVQEAYRQGSPVAIHAIEHEAILAAVRAMTQAPTGQDASPLRNRIEHCSEAPPEVVKLLKEAGITVVTQPGFLYESGERYRVEVSQEMQPWLYPIGSIRQAGVPVAAGSDAPVASPNPWFGIYAAVTRRDPSGEALNPDQGVPLEDALKLWTAAAAYASAEEETKGMLRPGMLADLVLLDRDVTKARSEDLLTCKAAMTVIGGEVVWER